MVKVTLCQRLNVAGFPLVKVKTARNGVPIPDPRATSYYLRYSVGGKQVREPVGTDFELAVVEWKKRQAQVLTTGVAVPEKKRDTGSLRDAADKYYANHEKKGSSADTISIYKTAVEAFLAWCPKKRVDEIDGVQDLLDYMGYLRSQPTKVRKAANPERTLFNKLDRARFFLKAAGVHPLLPQHQMPQYEEKMIAAHTDEELTALYAAADDDEKFFLDVMLATGFRDGDAMHAEYSDLKDRTWYVQRKPHYNWHPKKRHCRAITIPANVADAIRARGKTGLLFPNSEGRPDGHLLRRLHAIAEKAKATFHVENHKLRKTAATRWMLAGVPIRTIQQMLGHKSLTTTERYLADVRPPHVTDAIDRAAFQPKPKPEGAVVPIPIRRSA